MNIGRLVPMLVLVGGVGMTVANGDRIVKTVTDKVKTLLSGFELGNIRDALQSNVSGGGGIPGIDRNQVSLQEFLLDNFAGQKGSTRDPSLDLWDEPYCIEALEGEDEYLLYSNGPSGDTDCCVNLQGLISEVEMEAAQGTDESGVPLEGALPECDDICLPFTLIAAEGALDSPFRSLR